MEEAYNLKYLKHIKKEADCIYFEFESESLRIKIKDEDLKNRIYLESLKGVGFLEYDADSNEITIVN